MMYDIPNNSARINGSNIELPSLRDSPCIFRLTHSLGNTVAFTKEKKHFIIEVVEYTSKGELLTMLDTLEEFVLLTAMNGISCSVNISEDAIKLIDEHGILDHAYV